MLLRPRHCTPLHPGQSVFARRALVSALIAVLVTPVARLAAQDGESGGPTLLPPFPRRLVGG